MTKDTPKGGREISEEIVIISSDEDDQEYQRKRTNEKLKSLATQSLNDRTIVKSSNTKHRRSRSPRILNHRHSKGSSRRSRNRSSDRIRDRSQERYGSSRDRSRDRHRKSARDRSRSRQKHLDRSRDQHRLRARDELSRDRYENSSSRDQSGRWANARRRRSRSDECHVMRRSPSPRVMRRSPSPYLGAGPKLGDLIFKMDSLVEDRVRSNSPVVKKNGRKHSYSRSRSRSRNKSRRSYSSPKRKSKKSSRSRSPTPKRKTESLSKKKKHKKEKESEHKEHVSDKRKKHKKKKKAEKRSESRADSPSAGGSGSPRYTQSQSQTQKHSTRQPRSEKGRSTPEDYSASAESAPSPPPTPPSAPSAEVSETENGSPEAREESPAAGARFHPLAQDMASDEVGADNGTMAEDDLEKQALQVIALLKNEVADPELAPPAQPPKRVAQKPLVIDWLVQRLHNQSSDDPTPPKETVSPQQRAEQSTAGDENESLVSAQELTNQQALDKMVGQERVAEEVKIVLKPFYCRGTITKDEYKHIMRNCVTKIYQRSQGRINPARVKDYVEKYVGTVISRRK